MNNYENGFEKIYRYKIKKNIFGGEWVEEDL